MANAGMRGRPVVRLVLSAQERSYLKRQFVVTGLPNRCLSGAASFCDARTAWRAGIAARVFLTRRVPADLERSMTIRLQP